MPPKVVLFQRRVNDSTVPQAKPDKVGHQHADHEQRALDEPPLIKMSGTRNQPSQKGSYVRVSQIDDDWFTVFLRVNYFRHDQIT